MIAPLPTPEEIVLRHMAMLKDSPGYYAAKGAIRADREAIAKTMDQIASALEAVINDPESGEMLQSRGAVDALRIMIATLAPKE